MVPQAAHAGEYALTRVVDMIDRCEDGNQRVRDVRQARLLMIHRLGNYEAGGIFLGDRELVTAKDVAAAYAKHPEWIGTASMPYHLVIPPSGQIQVARPLKLRTPHAYEASQYAVGVAVLGDHRTRPPTQEQLAALAQLAAWWLGWAQIPARDCILPHAPGPVVYAGKYLHATKDPGKHCPGRYLDLGTVRRDAERLARRSAVTALNAAGIVLGA